MTWRAKNHSCDNWRWYITLQTSRRTRACLRKPMGGTRKSRVCSSCDKSSACSPKKKRQQRPERLPRQPQACGKMPIADSSKPCSEATGRQHEALDWFQPWIASSPRQQLRHRPLAFLLGEHPVYRPHPPCLAHPQAQQSLTQTHVAHQAQYWKVETIFFSWEVLERSNGPLYFN